MITKYYDSLGHEMSVGTIVMGCTSNGKIYGHIKEISLDSKGNAKYTIVPDIGCTTNLLPKLRKLYKIAWHNVFLIIIKRK